MTAEDPVLALVTWNLGDLWVYFVGPTLGAVAVASWRRGRTCLRSLQSSATTRDTQAPLRLSFPSPSRQGGSDRRLHQRPPADL